MVILRGKMQDGAEAVVEWEPWRLVDSAPGDFLWNRGLRAVEGYACKFRVNIGEWTTLQCDVRVAAINTATFLQGEFYAAAEGEGVDASTLKCDDPPPDREATLRAAALRAELHKLGQGLTDLMRERDELRSALEAIVPADGQDFPDYAPVTIHIRTGPNSETVTPGPCWVHFRRAREALNRSKAHG